MPIELLTQLVAQLGSAAVFLFQLNIVYRDGKAERREMLDRLENLESIKERITRIEEKLGIDDPPTLPKRPTN